MEQGQKWLKVKNMGKLSFPASLVAIQICGG